MASGSVNAEPGQEQTLVSQAVDGDAEAFGKLYTRHLDAIYRYIFFRVGEAAQAEDLTEEVFVRAWAGLSNYQSQGNRFSSWLYRIAHNIVVDHYRKESGADLIEHSSLEKLADKDTLPEDHMLDQQDMAALAGAIQRLGYDEQQVIILRFVEGLSHRETAKVIGKSEGASRVIQHRAIEALAEFMNVHE